MKAMILFHRALFAFMLATAFFAGALDAGRADMLDELMAERVLELSLRQLSNMRVM